MNEHDAIQQLAALLDGEQVDHADAPESLGTLVTLADTVRDHADLMAPTAEFRASLRAELVAAADPPPGLVERTRAAWTARAEGLRASTRVAVATMTASSMIGSAGVAVAAQEAVPGDLLYDVKGLTEDARLLLATDDVAEARLHLVLARERLEELRTTAGRLDTDEVVALLAEMDGHSAAGAEALLAGAGAGAVDASEVRLFASDQRTGITSVLHELPLMAKPVAEDSLELLRRIEVNATGVVPAADCDCEAPPVLGAADQDEAGEPSTPQDATRPHGQVLSISAPGEGPAVADLECDCIERPGGPSAREPAPAEESAAAPAEEPDEADEADEPERGSTRPSGELIRPRPSGDQAGGGDDQGSLDTSTSVERLPLDEVTDAADGTLDTDVVTDTAARLQEDVDDGLSGLLD